MDRGTLLVLLLIALLVFRVFTFAKSYGKPLRSDDEEITDAMREETARARERERLRGLADGQLEAARALHQLLAEDLTTTRGMIKHFNGGLFRRGSPTLVKQFTDDEKALVTELQALEGTIARLRAGAGAA